MVEEPFIAFTEITLTVFVAVKIKFVFEAAGAADIQMAADETFIAEVFFCAGEISFLFAGSEIFYGRFKDVAYTPFRVDEKIAAEDIAVMLNDDVIAAVSCEGADGMKAVQTIL